MIFALAPPPAAAETKPLSQRIVHYAIDARLHPETREVSGSETIRWRNATRTVAKDLYFHLYLNAFDNNRTTLMAALRDDAERWAARYPGEWGGIDVSAVRVEGLDVTAQLEPVRPDDGNVNDRTVARLPLPRGVRPNETIEVAVEFRVRLPRIFARAGHAAPFFMVAQWFPKLGVFEGGSWNCHQYHAATEFHADFGVYDARLTVPRDYVVGHTGSATGERDNGDGTRTITVRAEDVHDFAWAADPRFRVVEKRVGEVTVRLLVQPHHRRQVRRYLGAARATLGRYAEWFGPYPYAVLTIVDPGPGGRGAAGMEYPMLFTAGTAWWIPASIRLPEALVVHELGHQYWYGMVANNEAEEAWLDEGINSYVEGRIMDEVYGPSASYVDWRGLRLDAAAEGRLSYLRASSFDPLTRPAYQMLDRHSYQSVSYGKAALALRTLDAYLGGHRLREALRAYFEQWRFRHPKAADFRAAIEASVGEPLGWFFDQVINGTGVVDFAVGRLAVREVAPLVGRGTVAGAPAAENMQYENEVVIERRGDIALPVEILVAFEDGSEMRESWDGQDRWRRLTVVSTQRVAYVIVDPDLKLALDVNRLNNSRMSTPGTRGIIRIAGRWGIWLQTALHVLTGL